MVKVRFYRGRNSKYEVTHRIVGSRKPSIIPRKTRKTGKQVGLTEDSGNHEITGVRLIT
jgi:hypothetical protein